MDDVQIIRSEEVREKKPFFRILFVIFTIIILISAVAIASYLLGVKFSESNLSTKKIITPTEPVPTITAVQTITPPISMKTTPTAKISQTSTPTPTSKPIIKTKILTPKASLDGFRSSNGGGNNSLEIRAGRNSSLVTRGFMSFEISEIPNEANIQSATLRVYQAKIIGKPYVAGGSLKIDHLTYGDTLDESDYASPALSTGFANFDGSTSLGWKEVDVTARFKDDLANARYLSQFRIHFQTEVTGNDVAGDFVYFEAQENSMKSDNTPQLVIKYY